ncbi:MAG: hypothetical protein JNK82_36590 [Myxococcaceae bacterium]|nr:hypothetical protein [Myxococcaceae bacterium]
MSLEQALAKARAELEELKLREAEALKQAGVDSLIGQLTAQNQAIQDQRMQVREAIDRVEAELVVVRQRGAELELKLKGARSRVLKLSAVTEPRR